MGCEPHGWQHHRADHRSGVASTLGNVGWRCVVRGLRAHARFRVLAHQHALEACRACDWPTIPMRRTISTALIVGWLLGASTAAVGAAMSTNLYVLQPWNGGRDYELRLSQ